MSKKTLALGDARDDRNVEEGDDNYEAHDYNMIIIKTTSK